MNTKLMIPFDQNGNLMTWDGGWCKDWRPNFVFEAEMTFDHFSKGRSSVRAIFIDKEGKEHSFTTSELSKVIPHIEKGVIKGKFCFSKQGTNYGVSFVG